MKNLHLYTDESGNTGLNLFDDSQPYFWTCTLVADNNLNTIDITPLLDKLGVSRIHANVIGLDGIEKIAEDLISIIENKNYFLFTKIEKRFFVRLKLFDLIIDNGINKATTFHHYAVRGLRLPLAYNFEINVSPKSEEEFWKSYNESDTIMFCNVLRRVKANILHRVKDNRMAELLIDAINWALSNPEVFLEYKQSKLDSPNVAALGLLINSINKFTNNSGYEIVEFVHDRQNQFASSIKNTYELLKNTYSESLPTTIASDIKLVDNFKCPISILASDNCVGLQLTDIALWLVKRFLGKGLDGYIKSEKLFRIIAEQSIITGITHEYLLDELNEINRFMNEVPLTEIEINKGKEMLEILEKSRRGYLNS